ncbi:MAG: hypothetical protein AUK44_02840 [Porphyromonadaceae bacterium CG2_30_38_12]|nr:MAG: hypothetical protein AUK44_02840 [Porphyromonadaceae bacterium CG2_30_38_12]
MSAIEILQFITALSNNNNREWFLEHKSEFEAAKKAFDNLSSTLILEISKFDPEIKNVNAADCIFRIYRDIRFSHDKTPYKSHFAVFIATDGGRKSQRAGYYLHVDPAGCFIASGAWCPEPNLLKALRKSVYENIDEFNEIRNEKTFTNYFTNFYQQDKIKKIPAGFPKDFEEAELLKLKHYMVEYKLNDEMLCSKNFVQEIANIYKASYPLNRFLNYTIDECLKI